MEARRVVLESRHEDGEWRAMAVEWDEKQFAVTVEWRRENGKRRAEILE